MGAVKSQEGNANMENFEKLNGCAQHHLVVNLGLATWIYCALVDCFIFPTNYLSKIIMFRYNQIKWDFNCTLSSVWRGVCRKQWVGGCNVLEERKHCLLRGPTSKRGRGNILSAEAHTLDRRKANAHPRSIASSWNRSLKSQNGYDWPVSSTHVCNCIWQHACCWCFCTVWALQHCIWAC